MMSPPQRRRRFDPDLTQRIGRLIDTLQRYAILWVPVVWAIAQLGFEVVGPRHAAMQLQVQVDSLRKDIQKTHAIYLSVERQVNALVKHACLDPKMTPLEKAWIGICDANGQVVGLDP